MSTDLQVPGRTRHDTVTPDAIMQLGFAWWGSRTLLSAIELGVFAELANAGHLDGEQLAARVGLHERGARDFLDALVALGMIEREHGRYRNTPAADAFLDPRKAAYVGDFIAMAGNRPSWHSLNEALWTGRAQNESIGGDDFFEGVYADPAKLRGFLRAMTANSAGTARALAAAFPWQRYRTVIDVGCAEGGVPVALAIRHDHLTGGGFDLPVVGPVFDEFVERAGLADRLAFHPGDFFVDELPTADVLVMGHILHDWDLEQKRRLLDKAFAALPDGGALIVYEALIDDDRRRHAFGLLMSLNMLVETPGGFDYTAADCRRWLREAGFRDSYAEHLAGPTSMVVGIK